MTKSLILYGKPFSSWSEILSKNGYQSTQKSSQLQPAYQSSSKLIPLPHAYTSKNIWLKNIVQCARKSIGPTLVELITIVPCTPRLKIVSLQFQVERFMSYTFSGMQFFFWFCLVALWSVVSLWWMDLRKSVLFSLGIILF